MLIIHTDRDVIQDSASPTQGRMPMVSKECNNHIHISYTVYFKSIRSQAVCCPEHSPVLVAPRPSQWCPYALTKSAHSAFPFFFILHHNPFEPIRLGTLIHQAERSIHYDTDLFLNVPFWPFQIYSFDGFYGVPQPSK